jgi:hypothetical protein
MRFQRIAIVLTVINLVILVFTLTLVLRPAVSPPVATVIRTHALEIVDDQGKVRAEIIVVPASTMPDGQAYPDTALFRLIDPNGRPGVKIATSVDGSGLLLTGDSEKRDWSGVQIIAEGTGSRLRLLNKDGQEQVIQP